MSEELPPASAANELERVLAKRAERARAAPAPGENESASFVAEFPLGDERYAVPLDHLRAAVPMRAVTPVPLAPPHVLGVLRFQGQILTALSLASLLGGSAWREDPAVLLVVEPGAGRRFAIDCEQIPKPIGVPSALLEAALAGPPRLRRQITLPGDKRLHLLDLRQLDARAALEARDGA